jgi:hypothetical protein
MSDSEKKAIIDAYARKERKNHILSAVTILLSAALLLWFTQPPAGKTSNTSELIKSFVSVPTDFGDKLYLIVELENGQLVQVYIDNLAKYKRGKAINLQKQEPLFFGKTIYRYQGL